MLQSLQRIVVKLGSSLLVDSSGRFSKSSVTRLAADIAWLGGDGREVLVVSSGAVAIGCHLLEIDRRRARLDDLQAAAAAGQARLVQAWQEALTKHRLQTAQVLLNAGRYGAPAQILEREGDNCRSSWSVASFRSLTKTIPSQPTSCATATTIDSRRGSHRWSWPTGSSCCLTSLVCTQRTRERMPTRSSSRRCAASLVRRWQGRAPQGRGTVAAA